MSKLPPEYDSPEDLPPVGDDDRPTGWTIDPREAQCKQDMAKLDSGETCNAKAGKNSDPDSLHYCQNPAGKGLPDGYGGGRCSDHVTGCASPEFDRSGPNNPNWKGGEFSSWMGEEDAKRAERWTSIDGEEVRVAAAKEMLWECLVFEKARIERGAGLVPAPEVETLHLCATCGSKLADPGVDRCPNPGCERAETGLAPDDILEVDGGLEMSDGGLFWRIENLTELVETYKELVEGEDLNISGEVDLGWAESLRQAQREAGVRDE